MACMRINYAKMEYLYCVNGWKQIDGRWVDVNGNGFSQLSMDQAAILYGED